MEERLRTGRMSIIMVIKTFLSVVWAALREFVWADLRDGLIDMNGFSRPLRAIIWLGFTLTAVSLLLLTQTPALRHIFPLFTSVTSVIGRGLHIPVVLFPLTLFLLNLAWAYLLTGARQSHWLIRWSVLLIFLISAADWILTLLSGDQWEVMVASLLIASILMSEILPRSKRLRIPIYFGFYLIGVGGIFVVAQSRLIAQEQFSGLPFIETLIESNVRSLWTIALPLLFLIGLDIAYFVVHASTWMSQTAAAIFPYTLLLLTTVALLFWNLWQGQIFLLDQLTHVGWTSIAAQLGTSLGLVLLLWISWGMLRRLSVPRNAVSLKALTAGTSSTAMVLVIAFLLPLLTSFLLLEFAKLMALVALEFQNGFFGIYPVFVSWATTFYPTVLSISSGATVTLFLDRWGEVVAIISLLLAVFLARRNHLASALYLATVALHYLWLTALLPGSRLTFLGPPSPETVNLMIVVVLTITLLFDTRRGQLTTQRLQQILLLTLILMLFRQTGLIAAPLAPLFSLVGAGALALGLAWDMLTSGNWANRDTAWLPHTSRIFLYLGYILLTAIVVIWVVSAHDFDFSNRFTGKDALFGLAIFGYPYLFALIYVVLAGGGEDSSE